MTHPANQPLRGSRGPTAWLDEDGRHFWFNHECADVAKEWADKDYPLDEASATHFQEGRNHRMLPLGSQGWTVTQNEPLTISPSILCGNCGVHGWIREGKWVKA